MADLKTAKGRAIEALERARELCNGTLGTALERAMVWAAVDAALTEVRAIEELKRARSAGRRKGTDEVLRQATVAGTVRRDVVTGDSGRSTGGS